MTSGTEDPERAYVPFVLATTAISVGTDATIYFLLKGVNVLRKGEAEQVKHGEYPPLGEVIDQAVKAGVRLEVCEQSCMLLGLSKESLIDAAKIVGAITLNDRILEADAVLSF